MADASTKVREFTRQLRDKMQALLAEFADGKISREQFHVIYEKYTTQLSIVEQAMRSADPETVMNIAKDGPATIVLREGYMGKALGLLIYSHRAGTVIETLGDFDVPVARVAPVLHQYTKLMEEDQFLEKEVRKISSRQWLLFVPGQFTTAVTLFQNEPSPLQTRQIERLHHDFEIANRALLQTGKVDAAQLAFPFLVFIQNSLRK